MSPKDIKEAVGLHLSKDTGIKLTVASLYTLIISVIGFSIGTYAWMDSVTDQLAAMEVASNNQFIETNRRFDEIQKELDARTASRWTYYDEMMQNQKEENALGPDVKWPKPVHHP